MPTALPPDKITPEIL